MVLSAIFSNNVFAGADIDRIAPALKAESSTPFRTQQENIFKEKAIV